QADAEFLVSDGDRISSALNDGHRNLAAGEKTRFASVIRDQIGFGEALEQSSCLKRLQKRPDVVLGIEDKQVQEVAERERPIRFEIRCRILFGRGSGNRGL